MRLSSACWRRQAEGLLTLVIVLLALCGWCPAPALAAGGPTAAPALTAPETAPTPPASKEMAVAASLAQPLTPAPESPAIAAPAGRPFQYLCDGEPLIARYDNGAVDAPGIPNSVPLVPGNPSSLALAPGTTPDSTAITVPGAVVLLRWGELSLQLPRTNVAGAPSYSDGRWLWSPEDPQQPRFLERRGSVRTHACVKLP